MNRKFLNAWFNKGVSLYGQGRYGEALLAFEEAIMLNPEGAEAWLNKAAALNALGRKIEADAAQSRALELEGTG